MTNDDLRKYVQQILSYLKSDFDSYEEARKERKKGSDLLLAHVKNIIEKS